VATGVECGASVLVVEIGRAGDYAGVDAGRQDVAVILCCNSESELLRHGGDLGQAGSTNGDELDVLRTPGQYRKVGRCRPESRSDDTDSYF
jgi:hypothetical protein